MNAKHILGLAAILLAAVALGACDGGGDVREITKTRELKPPRTFPPGYPEAPKRFGFRRTTSDAGSGSPHGATPAPTTLKWDLPAGWQELPPQQFRQGNWRVHREEDVQAYLTVGVGGGILGNVNRWRAQMGLPPTTADELGKAERIPVLGRQGLVVALDGTFGGMSGGSANEGYRMIGVILSDAEGRATTLKLVGPVAKVERARDEFLGLCRSLRASTANDQGPARADGGHASTSSGLKFVVPKGWQKGRDRPMREVTLHPGDGEETECYVTILSAQAGDATMNVNMWRQQMSLAPIGAEEVEALPKVEVFGVPSPWVSVKGIYLGKSTMGNEPEKQEGYMLLALICSLPQATVTVKMVGPEKVVAAEKENFLAFCRSLHN